ncbi:hypothetical protein J2T02_002284 [Chitinophaga terrae (ex Kim and Jung 2007)]|uniref:cytochrome P460 family protein n=1 Tax=Chitinophaga terrae (ex Kim and Jung 2007) TaxID=408074 RepID=UPI0027845B9C|nr:cytochrome P460 family protein [Chitinophaga terrae (ex Kim and Jung 2007)]MDQ0107167.1 hypothetical protein [Chitinophaga terrae (ex Kim and Jung 2007)]
MKIQFLILFLGITILCGCSSKNESLFNEEAALIKLGDLPENPLQQHAITFSIHPGNQTMTIVYGNDPAYKYAQSTGDGLYPQGAVLYAVTFRIHQDEQWFGANVPGNLQSVERLEFLDHHHTKYQSFDASGNENTAAQYDLDEKIRRIRNQKIAVSPLPFNP